MSSSKNDLQYIVEICSLSIFILIIEEHKIYESHIIFKYSYIIV
jgi:hypothetical protein